MQAGTAGLPAVHDPVAQRPVGAPQNPRLLLLHAPPAMNKPRLHRFALATVLSLGLAGPALALDEEDLDMDSDTEVAAAPAAGGSTAVDPRHVWDLTTIFKDDAAWEAERQALLAEVPRLAALREGFGRDAASLRAGLDRLSAVNQRMRRLWTYASATLSTDNRLARNQERSAQARSLWGQMSSATAWVDSAIRDLGAARIEAFVKAEPGLAKHRVRLNETLRLARHQLAPEAEQALAAMSPVMNATTSIRTLLVTNEIEWPTLTVDGQAVRVDNIGYQRLRAHPDRKVRQQAFDAFFKTYARFQGSLGTALAQRVEAGVVNARLRQHPSAVAASLADNAIPESVYRTLVSETNKALPTLHRYLKLRQRLLQLPDLAYHDIYPDLIKAPRRWSPEDAGALTLASVAPLGAAYQQQLKEALSARTMHVFPVPGKSSGAYQSGVYGQVPLIFLNHQGTFDSVSTYTHEWGHGMHTLQANGAQPFETAGYPLFLAEIAAFTHELLLADHMKKTAATREERLFYLTEAIERIRGAFFRQAMFAEFELATHDAVQRGEALSGSRMTQQFCALLRKYHGSEQGVMQIDPAVCTEWAFIPHFHRPFYVYQYATSMAAASHFSQQLLAGAASGNTAARERYLSILRSGGSRHPVPLLKEAGLDMDSPAPYQALVRKMEGLMDELEALLGQNPG
jgi:oligoendopeptidase F